MSTTVPSPFCGWAHKRRRADSFFILGFHERARRAGVSWIGCQLRITRDGVIALLPAEVVEQLQQMINSILCASVVSLRTLWPLAGKLSNAARVLTAWCPLFGEFWAAKHLRARSGFGHWRPTLHASSWSLGGVLIDDCVGTSCISELVSKTTSTCSARRSVQRLVQQVVEALAMLVSLRPWASKWQQWRSAVEVRGDNVTMWAERCQCDGRRCESHAHARFLHTHCHNACARFR